MFDRIRIRHGLGAVCAVVLAFGAIFTAAALAAGFKSGTYKGTVKHDGITITLKLGGLELRSAHISNLPLYCSGGGPTIPITFKKAKVSSSGKFTAHGTYHILEGPYKGKPGAKLTLSGRFTTHGAVSGTLKTKWWNKVPRDCSGHSRFSATIESAGVSR